MTERDTQSTARYIYGWRTIRLPDLVLPAPGGIKVRIQRNTP